MTCWTGFQLVQPVEKNSRILTIYSPKNKESKKKKRRSIPNPDKGEPVKTRQRVYIIGLDMQDLLNRLPTSSTGWEKF